MYSKIVKLISSSFGLGFMPFWPGFWGSVAGLLISWFASSSLIVLIPLFSIVGMFLCAPAERIYGRKDPQVFVWDEVCGMMVAVFWIPRQALPFLAAFFLFRLFDVWKPWPVSVFQKMEHPTGIMWDDLVAGLMANVVLRVFLVVVGGGAHA